jgi:hypothetical protein
MAKEQGGRSGDDIAHQFHLELLAAKMQLALHEVRADILEKLRRFDQSLFRKGRISNSSVTEISDAGFRVAHNTDRRRVRLAVRSMISVPCIAFGGAAWTEKAGEWEDLDDHCLPASLDPKREISLAWKFENGNVHPIGVRRLANELFHLLIGE